MRQVLRRLVVFGSDKPVLCIIPYGLDCADLRHRGRQVQDLQPVVLLQIPPHLPVLVLACAVRYEEDLAPLAAHLLEVSYKRRAVKPPILPISRVPSSASVPYTMVLSLLPCLLTVTGSPTRDHSFLPFVPVLRNMDSSCITIVNPRLFAPDTVPVAPACHRLTESASAAEACMVADLLDENPRKRRILRTLHRLHLASSLRRIWFRSFLVVSMFLLASLSASFLIRPYPRAWRPCPFRERPGGHRCRPRRTAPPTAGPCAGPRLRRSRRDPLWGIPRVFRKHRHHPVADPDTSCSARMASVSSRIFLLFSSMGGSTIRRSLSFSVACHS